MRFKTKDSGKRQTYKTGALRDLAECKGRFDLISPIMLRRLAGVMERGAAKYEARNWEKGIPFSRLMDSACRHINQYREGHRDEDHLAQAIFNLMAAIHFEECNSKELQDLPRYV